MLLLSEEVLAKMLKVPYEGIRLVVGRTSSKTCMDEIKKMPNLNTFGFSKRFLKGRYQRLFEFVYKVLLPQFEKRIVASATDFILMENLRKFEPIMLPAIILEHMRKTLTVRDSKHELGYGYSLTRMVTYFWFSLEVGIRGTVKQTFSLHTLIECECIKEGQWS